MELKLGVEAKDKITGFKGIVVGHANYLFGCDRWGVAPKASNKDGKFNDTEWFDEGRIEVVGKGISPKEVTGKKPGADTNADDPR